MTYKQTREAIRALIKEHRVMPSPAIINFDDGWTEVLITLEPDYTACLYLYVPDDAMDLLLGKECQS